MDSPPLLSKNTLIVLAMIKIDPNGTLKDTCTNELLKNQVSEATR